MKTRTSFAFALLLAGALAGCSDAATDAAADAADEGPAAERAEALVFPTLAASMTWTEPSHDTITLIPGSDYESVVDDAPADHEVYQVLVDPRPDTQNGKITVSKYWEGTTAASCVNRSLSVLAISCPHGGFVYNSSLASTDVTSTFIQTGGEFPTSGCNATVTIDYPSTTGSVRVMAQARSKVTLPGVFGYTKAAVNVFAKGDSPGPKLVASMQLAPDGAASAVVVNQGPVTAPAVDIDITYQYDYCPPALSGESPYCVHDDLDQGECVGPFCGPGTWGFGQRQPLKCSWTKDFANNDIPANGGLMHWVWHQAGTQARCGLCVPGDNRCADPHAYVVAKSTVAPYSSMASAVSHDYGPNVL